MSELHEYFASYKKNTDQAQPRESKNKLTREQILSYMTQNLASLHPEIIAKDVRFAVGVGNSDSTLVLQVYDMHLNTSSEEIRVIEGFLCESDGRLRDNDFTTKLFHRVLEFLKSWVAGTKNAVQSDGQASGNMIIPLKSFINRQNYELIFSLVYIPGPTEVCRIGYSLLKI